MRRREVTGPEFRWNWEQVYFRRLFCPPRTSQLRQQKLETEGTNVRTSQAKQPGSIELGGIEPTAAAGASAWTPGENLDPGSSRSL